MAGIMCIVTEQMHSYNFVFVGSQSKTVSYAEVVSVCKDNYLF